MIDETAPTSRQFNVCIARFPGQNQEHPRSAGWVMKTIITMSRDPRIRALIPVAIADTPITMVRNATVTHALAANAHYILMIDADMHPDVEPDGKPFWDVAWGFMMARRAMEEQRYQESREDGADHDEAVAFVEKEFPPATIAAPYCGPPPDEQAYVMGWHGKDQESPNASEKFRLLLMDRDDAARRSGIEEVAALPTGLILYDARVFEKLPVPWFAYEWADKGHTQKATTEDVYQTRNASLLGMPQFVAWDCWAGHIKQKTVRKPVPFTPEWVAPTIREAVLKGTAKRIEFRRPEMMHSDYIAAVASRNVDLTS